MPYAPNEIALCLDIARAHRQTRVQILLSGVGVEDIGKAELAARFVCEAFSYKCMSV